MPPSQLKRLKASLREHGVVGPQKSKKQKIQNAQNNSTADKRVHRTAALSGIRENFNPFEFKISARGPKFEVTNSKTISGRVSKSVKGRPGMTKGLGEEKRRKTLLVELHRRNKVGGIMDRRFGENDPTMAPEDKMLERFTLEKQRRHKNSSAFDLEDFDEPGELTHMGQSLSLDSSILVDDFDGEGLVLSDADNHQSDSESNSHKRRRDSLLDGQTVDITDTEGQPERKKTKQEVMKEVIAKSKLYKYERQAAKDEDEDLREELDKEMGEVHALLLGTVPRSGATKMIMDMSGMNPQRAALLNGSEKIKLDKEYDLRLRQMAQDKRSKPTERTKTEEEMLVEESRRLQALETRRIRRMQGQPESDDDDNPITTNAGDRDFEKDQDFGLGAGIRAQNPRMRVGVEDEDDFIVDDDLVASGSDIESSSESGRSNYSDDAEAGEDDGFLNGLLTEEESRRPEFLTGANGPLQEINSPAKNGINGDLPYIFQCPQSHRELLEATKSIALYDLPEVVRRIRALYHPKLKAENKSKLGNFAVVLVEHISFLANQLPFPPLEVLDGLIRHIHSLTRTFPIEIANIFRKNLEDQSTLRALAPTTGDLVLAVAIGAVFPTSDHFHQVVTPSMLSMARYIGQKIPHELYEYATGIYISTLCLHYQRLSKRYVPEVIGFLLNTLCAFIPTKPITIPGSFPYHDSKYSRINDSHSAQVRNLNLLDTVAQELDLQAEITLKLALIETSIKLIDIAADFWIGKPAFNEILKPALLVLKHIGSKGCNEKLPKSTQHAASKILQKLDQLLRQAKMGRRPLELHHHRPLAIKTSIPKFEESYNPDKHYDPDHERAEASKLRAEHKRERKGAMRELRKDANFIARESLREKKEKDAAYEKKFKRLVAEIQGEEGREAKAYEREKEWRKKGRK